MDDATLYNVAAMTYGEMGSEDKEHWRMAASSYANSFGKGEWADLTSDELLNKRYYAVQNKNDPYKWATERKFPNDAEENRFKRVLSFVSAMDKGKESKTDAEFFWTNEEVAKQTKDKSINFDLLQKTGRVGKFNTYKYKTLEGIPTDSKMSFKKAFAEARRGGAKVFNWHGKSYTTDLAE